VQASNIPAKFPIAFASSAGAGFTRTVPQNPTGTVGQASLQTGFPPANFNPVAAGGVPPFGQDFNGLLNQITAWNQWVSAGGGAPTFDGTFSAAIGGYPNGAFLSALSNPGHFWISLVDNNTINPDAGYSAQWQPFPAALLANQVFFVNGSTGSDTLYDGTSATVSGSHGPWATPQHAASVISGLNLNGFVVTVNCADATYSSSTPFTVPPMSGSGSVNFVGDTTNPQNCVIANNTAGSAVIINASNNVNFNGFKFTAAAANGATGDPGCGILLLNSGTACTLQNIEWGTCFGGYVTAEFGPSVGYGGSLYISGSTTGNPGFQALSGASMRSLPTAPALTIRNAVTVSIFIVADTARTDLLFSSIANPGNVTGTRYLAERNGVINTNGGGATYYPGTVGGSNPTGGQYT
jgi:hypothetical protein